LRLNISEADNALDLELVRSVATYFRVSAKLANQIIARSQAVVKQWPKLAKQLGLSTREQKHMASAFRLAG
jgi:serine/threonine-protein kinase HipA